MSKLRKFAKGEQCTLQIHPYCNGDSDTSVLCHLPSDGQGLAIKSPDWWSAVGCSTCHDVIDGRLKTDLDDSEVKACMIRGLYRTHLLFIEKGLLNVKV